MGNGTVVNVSDDLGDRVRKASVRVSPSLVESVKLSIELDGAPYTIQGLERKGVTIVNGTNGENFPKGYDKRKEDQERSDAIELAKRFSLKTALIFWDNNNRYDATVSLDNIASVTSHLDIETTVDVITKFNKLVSYEKRTFNGKSTPNTVNIIPYLFENILPRLKGVKVEERFGTIDGLVKKATELIQEASTEYRTQSEPLVVQDEKIKLLERYAESKGLTKQSNGNGKLDMEKIRLYTTVSHQRRDDLVDVSLKYHGIIGENSGTVKVFDSTGEVMSVDVNGRKTREEAGILATFGERLLTTLPPGTGQYTATAKAVSILKQKFA